MAAAGLAIVLVSRGGLAQVPAPAAVGAGPGPAATPAIDFTPEYLSDPKNVEQGRAVWRTRCQFCHGKTAYPGKAPRLDPSRYTPEFVYDRVANGFRGMPPWRHEFSVEQLKAVVAYVLSKDFSN